MVEQSMEQRAVVRRCLQFAGVALAIGAVLSVFLIASGNAGGWGVLVILLAIAMVCSYVAQKGKRSRP